MNIQDGFIGEYEKVNGAPHMPITPQLLFDEFGFVYSECVQTRFRCYHVADSKLTTPPFLLKIASKQKGYGLFALTLIAKGERMGVYAGRLREVGFLFPQTNPYCLQYPSKWWLFPRVIDAYRVGSLMRFLNHSEDPNVGVVWQSGPIQIPIITAIRDIKLGEEIVISYGPAFRFPS